MKKTIITLILVLGTVVCADELSAEFSFYNSQSRRVIRRPGRIIVQNNMQYYYYNEYEDPKFFEQLSRALDAATKGAHLSTGVHSDYLMAFYYSTETITDEVINKDCKKITAFRISILSY